MSARNWSLKQITKTDISVIHTTDHFQSTLKVWISVILGLVKSIYMSTDQIKFCVNISLLNVRISSTKVKPLSLVLLIFISIMAYICRFYAWFFASVDFQMCFRLEEVQSESHDLKKDNNTKNSNTNRTAQGQSNQSEAAASYGSRKWVFMPFSINFNIFVNC